MNLTEYLNQPDPQRLPDFSVEVKRDECYHIVPVPKGTVVVLKIPQFLKHLGTDHFRYFIHEGGKGMWVIKDEINTNYRPSVFKLID